jgi:hypothetical protein
MNENENQYQGQDFLEYQIDSTASLLCSSLSELAPCSSRTVTQVELALRVAFREVSPATIQHVINTVNNCFTGENDDEP